MLEKKAIAALIISFCSFFSGFLRLSVASEATKTPYPYEMSYYVERYNFMNSEVKDVMPLVEKENLQYFIDNVVPVIPSEYDAQLMFWWAYIEGTISKKTAPWEFSNCSDKDKNPNTDCTLFYERNLPPSGKWQVGYGIQVSDNIKSLKDVFNNTHPGKTEKEIGDIVLSKAGQTNIIFPQNLTIELMVDSPKEQTSSKSNAYWASVLMRDPIISAYFLARLCNERTDFCACFGKHKGNAVTPPHWCGPNTWYLKKKKEHSMMMKKLINTWSTLTNGPASPSNLHIIDY